MIRIPAGQVMTVAEYAESAKLTRQAIYNAIKQGRLKAYKVGQIYLIPANALIQKPRLKHGRYVGLYKFLREKNAESIE